MKLITDQTNLEKEFRRLAKKYQSFYWSAAWAGINSKPFDDLKTTEHKIEKLIIGIHFYQTHPDFIETFQKNKNVRYILQSGGTFHPKLYLFTNSDNEWELLVGSGNFTNGAFNTNKEATVLLSHTDNLSGDIYVQAKKFVEQAWMEGQTMTSSELEKYRITWKNQQSKIHSLSGRYGGTKRKSTPIHEVEIVTKTWREFITQVVSEASHGVEKRLSVIELTHELFAGIEHFGQLKEEERKFIAGIPNELNRQGADLWGYFGSMQGAGIFKNRIIANDRNISRALDQIPLSGQITRKHYGDFIRYYHQIFSGTRLETATNIATASRLLAMKRPDVFVCYDVKNKARLSKDFGIVQTGMSYDRYWDDIIERIYDSEWWRNPEPLNSIERKVSEARAAFLDSLYYEW